MIIEALNSICYGIGKVFVVGVQVVLVCMVVPKVVGDIVFSILKVMDKIAAKKEKE